MITGPDDRPINKNTGFLMSIFCGLLGIIEAVHCRPTGQKKNGLGPDFGY